MSDGMIRQISEAIRIRGERPAREQIQDMIDRGAIDINGKVLLQGPSHQDVERSSKTTLDRPIG